MTTSGGDAVDVVGELGELLADPDPAMRRLAMDELTRLVDRAPAVDVLAALLRGLHDPARQVRDAACAAFVAIEGARPEDGGWLRRHLSGGARLAVDEAAALDHAGVDRHARAMAALPLDEPDWLVAALVACLTLLERAQRDGWQASHHALLALLGQISPAALWEILRAGREASSVLGILAALPQLPAWTWQDVTAALGRSRRDVVAGQALVQARVRAGTAVPAAVKTALVEAIPRLAAAPDPLDRVAAIQLAGAESWPLLETASWDADPRVRDAVRMELERVIASGQDVDRAWRMIDRLGSA